MGAGKRSPFLLVFMARIVFFSLLLALSITTQFSACYFRLGLIGLAILLAFEL
jgi:hypothetical protein